jgi:hypothetical protein
MEGHLKPKHSYIMRDKRGEFLCLFLKNGRHFKLMKNPMHWRDPFDS